MRSRKDDFSIRVGIGKILGFIKRRNNYEIALVLAIMQSVVSYFVSRDFFVFDAENEIARRNKLLVDILFFVVMFFVYAGLVKLVRNHKKYRKQIKFGLIYFGILMIILVLVWPGVWRGGGDDFIVALEAKKYLTHAWHHSLTSILFMLSFRLIPVFVGAVIVQCVIIAVITTCLYCGLVRMFKLKTMVAKIVLMVPFLLPPILDNAMYPLRPILYGYVIVFLIYLMIEGLRLKRIGKLRLVLMVIMFALASAWRSEGVYYTGVAVVYFGYFAIKKYGGRRLMLTAMVGVMGLVYAISGFQNATLTHEEQMGYKVLGLATIMEPLVRKANLEGGNEGVLAEIDRVINVSDIVNDKDSKTGHDFYWSDGLRSDYDEDDYGTYIQGVVKLALKYPETVLKTMLKNFALTAAIGSAVLNDTTEYTEVLNDDFYARKVEEWREYYERRHLDVPDERKYWEIYSTEREFIEQGGDVMKSWNPELRKVVISVLEGKENDDYSAVNWFGVVTWNLVVPVMAIIICVVIALIRRSFGIALCVGSSLVGMVIVMATAPLILHMYYYSEYLLGHVIIGVVLSWWVQGLIHRKQKRYVGYEGARI